MTTQTNLRVYHYKPVGIGDNSKVPKIRTDRHSIHWPKQQTTKSNTYPNLTWKSTVQTIDFFDSIDPTHPA